MQVPHCIACPPPPLPCPRPLSSERSALCCAVRRRHGMRPACCGPPAISAGSRVRSSCLQHCPPAANAAVTWPPSCTAARPATRRAAEALHAARLEAAGLPACSLRADAHPLRELKDERLLYIAISALQGRRDPPDDALGFVDFPVRQARAATAAAEVRGAGTGRFQRVRSSAVGQCIDARLAELGALRPMWPTPISMSKPCPRAWTTHAVDAAGRNCSNQRRAAGHGRPVAPASRYRRRTARTPVRRRAAGQPAHHRRCGSARDIRHIELSFEGSGLYQYEPGDALGVWSRNPPALVDALLAALEFDGDAGWRMPVVNRRCANGWPASARSPRPRARSSPAMRRRPATLRSTACWRRRTPAQPALLGESQPDRPVAHDSRSLDRGGFHRRLAPAAAAPVFHRLQPQGGRREAHLALAHVEYDNGHGLRWGRPRTSSPAAGRRARRCLHRSQRTLSRPPTPRATS